MKEFSDTVTSMAAKETDNLKSFSIQDVYLLVTAIWNVDELLLFVG
jgi:hypothetical protein